MTIRIVTDSACDLPEELAKQLGISIVPLYINIGNISYEDGVDLKREEFYKNLPLYGDFPKTAAPGPDHFKCLYDKLADEGATGIISIHISESLSNTVLSAKQGARECKKVPVNVIDSQNLSLGAGLLVIAAAKAAFDDADMDDIVELIRELTKRTYTVAAIDTLEYLRRGGRMSVAVAQLGTLLKIKPILKMNQGEPTAERVRTSRRAMERIVEILDQLSPVQELHYVHTDSSEQLEIFKNISTRFIPEGNVPYSVKVTPVLGAHLGPGAVGFSCIACEGFEMPCESFVHEVARLARNIRG